MSLHNCNLSQSRYVKSSVVHNRIFLKLGSDLDPLNKETDSADEHLSMTPTPLYLIVNQTYDKFSLGSESLLRKWKNPKKG